MSSRGTTSRCSQWWCQPLAWHRAGVCKAEQTNRIKEDFFPSLWGLHSPSCSLRPCLPGLPFYGTSMGASDCLRPLQLLYMNLKRYFSENAKQYNTGVNNGCSQVRETPDQILALIFISKLLDYRQVTSYLCASFPRFYKMGTVTLSLSQDIMHVKPRASLKRGQML